MVLLSKVPGMTVFAPSSYQEVGQMLHDALEITDGPSAIRWAKTDARHVGPDEIGSGLNARQLQAGTELCIISVGKMLDAAEAAAAQLESEGISVSLWDARLVKPLDINMLTAAAEHPYVITIEDGLRDGGVGSAIADSLSELTLGSTPVRVRILGVPTQYIAHGKPAAILAELGLDAAGITESARSLCRAEGNVTA